MKPRKTGRFTEYYAECHDCDFLQEGKNALGISAQHHDRTGHRISIEIRTTVMYGDFSAVQGR